MTEGSSPAAQSTTPPQTSPTTGSPVAAVASQVSGTGGGVGSQNAPVGTSGASGAQNAPAETGGAQTIDMAKIFGEDFVKDPALKDFKDPSSFVKAFKDTKAMVGKPRFDVPGQDTPAEQAAEFYKKLGVPDSAEAYALKPDANIPEHNNETNIEFLKAFSGVAHELKLTSAQAVGMQKFFDDLAVNLNKSQAAAQEQEDAQLTELLTKALPGEDLSVAEQRIKAEIEAMIPENLRERLAGKINNEALAAIAIMDRHYREKYGQSDKNAGDPGASSGKSLSDLRKEASALYSEIMKNGPMHPKYKENTDRYNSMYKTIGELSAAGARK